MNAANFFYYSVGIGIWVIIAIWMVVAIQVAKSFKSVGKAAEQTSVMAKDTAGWKTIIPLTAATILDSLVNRRGGEKKNGKE